MPSLTELWYRAKKLYSIYPGVIAPVSGRFLADHYARRRRARGPLRAALDAIVGTLFLAWIPLRARVAQRRYGLDVAWRRKAARIARARFADPNDIALFRIERADQLDDYIRRFEDAGLNKLINPLGWMPACALADKIRFYERCRAHGLRHPTVVAEIVGRQIKVIAPAEGRRLLLKPARGEGGRGVRLLAGDPPDQPEALAAWIRAQAGRLRGGWVVQLRIVPHPALADIALGALPTARITTILNDRDEPEVVSAVLRIPSDPAVVVDNMKAGGLLSSVALDDGALSVACKGYGGGTYERHPVTGAVIPGRLLPDWAAAKALAIHAHRAGFSDYAIVGWDVGLAPDGPVLVEGNGKPGVLMPQRSGGKGLGEQRYGELLAGRLARCGKLPG
jgi:hypothetical protein